MMETVVVNPSCSVHFRKLYKIKIELNFIFTLLCGASDGFIKTFKDFIKHFGPPQRSVKIKILVNFFLDREGKN